MASPSPPALIISDGWPGVPETLADRPLAVFDMDGTLITPKRARQVRANAADDWDFRWPSVPETLATFAREGWLVAVLTNQSARGRKKGTNDSIVRAVLNSVRERISGVPLLMVAAAANDHHRKPMRGMWDWLMARAGRRETEAADFYCGDAAGRAAARGRSRDFANTDRLLAHNVGVRFRVPEEIFAGAPPPELPPLSPTRIAGTDLPGALTAVIDCVRGLRGAHSGSVIVVPVGLPGSGKTTIAAALARRFPNVSHASQDTIGGTRFVRHVANLCRSENAVVVADRTNLTRKNRGKLTSLGIPTIAVILDAWDESGKPVATAAWHRNCLRAQSGGRFVPKIAYRTLARNATPVAADERFVAIVSTPMGVDDFQTFE